MNDRERFMACVLGETLDRPPFWLYWCPWRTTWQRWVREGLPPGVTDWQQLRRHLGADIPPQVVPVQCGPCPAIERTVLQETDESITFIDSWGITRRNLKGRESMSEFVAFPVKDCAGWEWFRDERLNPDDPRRLDGDWLVRCRDWAERGWPIQLGSFPDVGVFGTVRWLLGDEEGLAAFYTMPDLVYQIMDHMTSLYLTVFEKVTRQVRVDVIHIWEDMCGRQGPLISPKHWEEFLGPCYRRIKAFADAHNIAVISVDTDGRPDEIIPRMMRAGVNWLFPMEVAAGCDVVQMRRQFPGLAMMGGIDKRALAQGHKAIDRELDRVWPAVAAGRYIPELDHLIPDDVSWDNFLYYAQQLKRRIVGGC